MIILPNRRKAFQSSGAWSPASLGADLKMAFVANEITGNDGDFIETWPAAYSTPHPVTQATLSRRPTLKTNFINGLKALYFDRSDDYMATSGDITSLEGISSLTLVFVAKMQYPVIGIGPVIAKHSSGTFGSWFAGAPGSSSGCQFSTINSSSSRINLIQTTFSGSWTDWHVFVCDWDGTTMRLYVDGVLQSTTTLQSGVLQNNSYPVTVGSTDSGGFLYYGHIAEIGAITPSLSTVNRKLYEAFLSSRYNITITP